MEGPEDVPVGGKNQGKVIALSGSNQARHSKTSFCLLILVPSRACSAQVILGSPWFDLSMERAVERGAWSEATPASLKSAIFSSSCVSCCALAEWSWWLVCGATW